MGTLFNRLHKREIDLIKFPKQTPSAFLIPKHLIPVLFKILPKIISKKGKTILDLRAGLNLLLDKYRGFFAIGYIPFKEKPKLTFQDTGQDLQRIVFRPTNADWVELGIIANGIGASKCWLFSYLLELELAGVGEFLELAPIWKAVSTPRVSRPRGIFHITGRRRYFQRILHFRV